jgi:glycosyltransferase involved in cell wall biosynthesis
LTTQPRQPSLPLRILHVTASMAAEIGGPAVVCAGLTAALAARGHQVTVAALEQEGQTSIPLDPAVQSRNFPVDGFQRYAVSHALDRWLRDNIAQFDIVHLHSIWQFPTFAAARACWRAHKPYVVLLNGMLDRYSVHQRSAWAKRLYWCLRERRVEGRAEGLHVLNRAEIRKAVPWIRDMPKFILPNGIDEAQLTTMPARGAFRAAHPEFSAKPLVLFLSRLHPKKGLDRLIPAWKALARQLPDARLLIAGTGEADYVASLKSLVAANELRHEIIFLGQLVGAPKWQALVDADLFVLPSHQEGFSMAITEALAAGTPPVITEECNFDELAPPASEPPSGIIIKNGDMSAFVAAVADLLQSPEKRRALAAAGRSLVSSRYTWQKIAAQLEQTYRDILAGKRLPAHP